MEIEEGLLDAHDDAALNTHRSPGEVIEIEGSLLDAPDGAALIHACNSRGVWGKGVAKELKARYPTAFEVYRSHCHWFTHRTRERVVEIDGEFRSIRAPEGTCLIIPPQKADYEANEANEATDVRHWIICLFTSRGYGRLVSPSDVVMENTEIAVADMRRQLDKIALDDTIDDWITELWACRFNSGLFGVPWSETKKILESSGLSITVATPAAE
ncbi:phosphatase [Aspergillus ellipticus CBS 707.79]|uniref:Phosphatase n=1 Tax=Aspergillus ellipticus CBS 707.79 TaxID=1448320 RepID=A0A319CZD7_9EURO|nr:phosphatase [Aspergillus ellipticus CBS 707.79]